MRIAILSLVLLLLASGSSLAESNPCISAEIDAPIVLPDGSEHPSGRLTLCIERLYSPVEALHVVSVNQQPVRFLISRRGFSEGPAGESPYMMFHTRPDGALQLYGYALPGSERMRTFLMLSRSGRKRDV